MELQNLTHLVQLHAKYPLFQFTNFFGDLEKMEDMKRQSACVKNQV